MQKLIPEALKPLWERDHEHYALYGGRGGSKSHGIAEPIVYHACKGKETVVCGRQYQNSIKDSSKRLIERKIYDMGMAVYFKITDRDITNVSTGSTFSFVGMDRNPESNKSLEGCTIFWGEEAQTFILHSVELIIPTIRAPGSRMYWSWNPRFRTDPVDEMFRGKFPPENSYIQEVSWRNNPWFFQTRMPSEFRRSKRAKPKRHIHIWEGGYDENPDVAVFTDWREGIIDVDQYEKVYPRFGMDFGFSVDPYAVIKSYLIPEIDTIYVAEEAYGHRVKNQELPDLMDQISGVKSWPIIGDSSRPETIDQLNAFGYSVYGSRKGQGSVKHGLNFISGYHLVIHPSCANLIEEVRTYSWKVDPIGKPMPIPAPNQPDHGIDALRYGHEEDSLVGEDDDNDGVDHI